MSSSAAPIKNYLVESILVTLCCCLPLGVVGIVFAAQVNGKQAAGDIAGAQSAANTAKMCCIIGAIGGVVVGVIYGVIGAMGAAAQR